MNATSKKAKKSALKKPNGSKPRKPKSSTSKAPDKPVAPKASDKPVAPKASDKPVAPKASDKPVAPKASDKPAAPKADRAGIGDVWAITGLSLGGLTLIGFLYMQIVVFPEYRDLYQGIDTATSMLPLILNILSGVLALGALMLGIMYFKKAKQQPKLAPRKLAVMSTIASAAAVVSLLASTLFILASIYSITEEAVEINEAPSHQSL